MSVLKVIEILGNSKESFEDAVQNIVSEASKTIKDTVWEWYQSVFYTRLNPRFGKIIVMNTIASTIFIKIYPIQRIHINLIIAYHTVITI